MVTIMIMEDTIKVRADDFKGIEGDSLFIDIKKLRDEFAYCGLWYGRDGSAESVITTSLYYADGDTRPEDPAEELKENSFQQAGRFRVPTERGSVWIAARTSDDAFCRIQLSPFRKESAYVNYKVIRNRAGGVEVLGSGILRGGEAWFAKIGIEDRFGAVDFKDAVFYLVLIKDPPPDEWSAASCIGVVGLPLVAPPCRFAVDRKYSPWNGQNPLDGTGG